MGNAAWVNTGGLFYTQESSNNKQFYVHTYEGHGEANTESVRLQLFYDITKIYYKPGSKWNSKYPQMWELECYDEADEANYGSPATITCTDNEQLVEGVYMMGFGTDIVGNGVQNIQVMNTAGHKRGSFYEIQLNDKNGDLSSLIHCRSSNTTELL